MLRLVHTFIGVLAVKYAIANTNKKHKLRKRPVPYLDCWKSKEERDTVRKCIRNRVYVRPMKICFASRLTNHLIHSLGLLCW